MKTIRPLIYTILFATLLGTTPADDYEVSTRFKIGDEAPKFTCQTLGGKSFSIDEHKGKVILINFFATWCGPCISEMPHLQKDIVDAYKNQKDLIIIAIGREHEQPELEKFRIKHGLSIPMAADPNREIYSKFADKYIPRNILIGRDGTIKFASVGFQEAEFSALIKLVDTELNSQSGSRRVEATE
jgi:peroxiredoxin